MSYDCQRSFVTWSRICVGRPSYTWGTQKQYEAPTTKRAISTGSRSVPSPSHPLPSPSHPLPPPPNPSPHPSLWHDFNHDTIYSALFSLWARLANRIMFVCACPGTQIYICRLKPYRTISLEWRDEHALMPHTRYNAPLTHFIIARY